jgi:hypothetical protein
VSVEDDKQEEGALTEPSEESGESVQGSPDDADAQVSEPAQKEPAPKEFSAENLNPVKDLRKTLRQIHSRYLLVLLSLFGVAAAVTMAMVILNPVRDWFLFMAMYLVLFAYLILYIKAHQKKHRILRFLSLLTCSLLLTFWIAILIDRIPARWVFVDEAIIQRPDMPALWAAVGLLGVVGVGLWVHWGYVGRFHEKWYSIEEPPNAEPAATPDQQTNEMESTDGQ